MNDTPKSNKVLKILYIITPLLMVFTVVILVYAWYTNTLQTGEIDTTTKNFSVEYTFDEDTEKNVLTYTTGDIAFFDYDATQEIDFLDDEAIPLEINLTNKSESDMNYTITFKATKTVVTGDDGPESVAYVGAVLDYTGLGTTYTSIKAKYDADTTHTNYNAALYDATDATNTNTLTVQTTGSITASATEATTITMYLFGIQEIDGAINSQFLFNGSALRTYTFELTIYAEPISNSTQTEN